MVKKRLIKRQLRPIKARLIPIKRRLSPIKRRTHKGQPKAHKDPIKKYVKIKTIFIFTYIRFTFLINVYFII
jgi:hypothetical protein